MLSKIPPGRGRPPALVGLLQTNACISLDRVTQHRRSRAVGKAADAQIALGDKSKVRGFERLKQKVAHGEAVGQAKMEMLGDDLEDRFAQLEKEDEIERLLSEIKSKRAAGQQHA